LRDISAETMKMPDPIIDPATSMVESNRPSPRVKPALALSELCTDPGVVDMIL